MPKAGQMQKTKTVILIYNERSVFHKLSLLLCALLTVGVGIDLRWASGQISGNTNAPAAKFVGFVERDYQFTAYFLVVALIFAIWIVTTVIDTAYEKRKMADKLRRFKEKFPSQSEQERKIAEVFPLSEKPILMSQERYFERALLRWSLLEGDTDVKATIFFGQ
jgi:hypothetical protein